MRLFQVYKHAGDPARVGGQFAIPTGPAIHADTALSACSREMLREKCLQSLAAHTCMFADRASTLYTADGKYVYCAFEVMS